MKALHDLGITKQRVYRSEKEYEFNIRDIIYGFAVTRCRVDGECY